MRTQGEIEAAISEGISRFQQDYMGRGPKDKEATGVVHGIAVSNKSDLDDEEDEDEDSEDPSDEDDR
jgi:uncharacterized protein YbcI